MKTKKMNMGGMADREGRAMAAGRLAGRPGMMADARGRAMMKKGGKIKKMKDMQNNTPKTRAAERKRKMFMSDKQKRDEKPIGALEAEQRRTMFMTDKQKRDARPDFLETRESKQKRTKEGKKKGGTVKKMRAGGNTSRMNEIEELGRVDAEKGYSAKGKKNLKDEKARVVREIKNKKAGGKVGYKAGGMMADKEGRALAKDKKGMTAAQMSDARGRAMKKGGATMKAKGKKMMGGGKVKAYKKGGSVSSASKRADGIAQRGHTRGRHV